MRRLDESKNPLDRRRGTRFPLTQDIRLRGLSADPKAVSLGRTVNMSSTGVLFTTAGTLTRGEQIEACIHWPVALNSRVNLQLVARGRVVRSQPGLAAMVILQHQFRTQPKARAAD